MSEEARDFRARYERHVQFVLDGDIKSALADMVRENLPKVFEGVTVPAGNVVSLRVVDVRKEGGTWIGETVYTTADGPIGLRSIWEAHDGVWLAAALENFPAPEEA